MGLSFGQTKSSSNASSTSTPTYSDPQNFLQGLLGGVLSSLAPALSNGGISPNVTAVQTQNADTINKQYSSLGDRMQKFLASRGLGQSGQSGQVQLQTELGRQGALAGNNANAASNQLQQNNGLLSDALAFAFANPGTSATGVNTGTSSGWGASIAGGAGGGPGGMAWGIA